MKRLTLFILFLVSLFSGAAMSQTPGKGPISFKDLVVEDAKDFKFTFEQALQDPRTAKAAVDTVVYDLEHMEDIVKDLDQQSAAASNGLTKEVVAEVRRRFQVANALMTSIMIDTKMPLDKKKEYLNEIASVLTQVFFRVLREHGEDEKKKIEDMKTGILAGTLRVPREWFLDATAFLRMRRAAKLKEIDDQGKEINAGPGPLVPAILDRGRRDALTLELIQELQESIHLTLNKLDDSDVVEEKFIPTYWGEKVIPRAVKLRSLDLNAERFAALSYAGFALWGLFSPEFDLVGLLDGGRSEYSLFDSSLIYATFWTSFAAVKASTISSSTVTELKKLLAMTKDQKIEPTRGNIGGFWTRLLSSIGVKQDGCVAALAPEKPKFGR